MLPIYIFFHYIHTLYFYALLLCFLETTFFSITSDFIANYDYIGLKDTLTFEPFQSIECVDIQIINDSLAEGLESFTVQLTTNSSEIVVITSLVIVHIQPSDGKK